MELFNSKEINKVLKVNIEKNLIINDISIDSRKIKGNTLFIPLKGLNYDGHDFILDAFNNGAVACLSRNDYKSRVKSSEDRVIIGVDNTLDALTKLASYSRDRIKDLELIGITGSNGKTTLKEWCSIILKKFYKIHHTEGNYNNQIGLPLSLSKMPKDTDVCILELGTNHPGEIKKLSKICKPTIAIITNIGSAHIGNFKNKKKIAEEKADIYSFIKNGFALVPDFSEFSKYISDKAKRYTKKIITFGYDKQSHGKIIKQVEGGILKFKIFENYSTINRKDISEHLQVNLLIILLITKILGLKQKLVSKYILELKPYMGRGNIDTFIIKNKTIRLIDDSYNANPDSMKNAIKNMLIISQQNERKVCIIGDMLELGKLSREYHLELCNEIMNSKIDVVYTLGKHSEIISNNLSKKISTKHFKKIPELITHLKKNLKDKDLILVKGSNSFGLKNISLELGKGA